MYANESCDERAVYFSGDWNDAPSPFWSLAIMWFLLDWFSCIYSCVLNHCQVYSTVNKVGSENLLQGNPVLCRINCLLISYLISKPARLHTFWTAILFYLFLFFPSISFHFSRLFSIHCLPTHYVCSVIHLLDYKWFFMSLFFSYHPPPFYCVLSDFKIRK